MIAKIFPILLLAISLSFSSPDAAAEFHLTESLLTQTQSHFCAETDSDEKKIIPEEEQEEEEEPDCD